MDNLKAISLTYENAPIEQREYVALDEADTKKLLKHYHDVLGIQEMLILSTCNRTEFYYTSADSRKKDILESFNYILGKEIEHLKDLFEETNKHKDAVRRMFEVSIGLKSMVVGDMQITNQVKNAYQWSADLQMAGPFLHRLMHTVFFANKRVVQETAFRDGAASIAYVSKSMVEDLSKHLQNPKVLILGAGEIATDLIDNLKNTTNKVYLSNRTDEKSAELAQKYDFTQVPFSEVLEFAVKKADIIVSTIAVKEPFIKREEFVNLKLKSHKYLLDLSVPSSIDRSLHDVEGIVLYTVDELNEKANEALTLRLEALKPASKIIDESISEFNDWSRDMIVSPAIKKLKATLEDIRKDELKRYLKSATKEESALLDKASKSMMQKVLKLPVLNLKAACKRGEAESLVEMLNDLFNLEKDSKIESN